MHVSVVCVFAGMYVRICVSLCEGGRRRERRDTQREEADFSECWAWVAGKMDTLPSGLFPWTQHGSGLHSPGNPPFHVSGGSCRVARGFEGLVHDTNRGSSGGGER